MGLRGQGSERGYAMAALLVSLAVMAVLMSAALPAWRHLARREKEAELAFRGEQYARAVALYRAKNGNTFPASIDILVQGKYLRKKYKDPMSADGEFRILPVGNPQTPQGGDGRGGTPPPSQGRGATPPTPAPNNPAPNAPGQTGSFVSGGIMGVASKSTENSIRIYKGQTRYDLWPFTFNVVNRPGGNMPGAGQPGMGGPGQPTPGGPGRGGRGPGGGLPGPGRGGPGREGGPGRGIGPFIGPDGRPNMPQPMPFPGGRGRGGGNAPEL
jgi:type II secretory pathway pseudopilin PulG